MKYTRGGWCMVVSVGVLLSAEACVKRECAQSTTEPVIASEVTGPARKVGGSCEYARYAGTAAITRVEKTERSRAQVSTAGGPGYEGYEIWFTFVPAQEIEDARVRGRTGKEYLLLLANSWYPGPRYIEKYGVRSGTLYPCTMQVITRGSCTPVIFEFVNLTRDDYFEAQGKRE